MALASGITFSSSEYICWLRRCWDNTCNITEENSSIPQKHFCLPDRQTDQVQIPPSRLCPACPDKCCSMDYGPLTYKNAHTLPVLFNWDSLWIIDTRFTDLMALALSELSVSKHFKKHYNLIKLFNSIFSRTTWVSRYQKGKIEARDDSVFGTAVASARPYANNMHLAPDR